MVGSFRDESRDGDFDLIGIVDPHRVLVERRQCSDDATEDRHGVCVTRESVVERPHVLVDHRVMFGSSCGRPSDSSAVGSFAVDQHRYATSTKSQFAASSSMG